MVLRRFRARLEWTPHMHRLRDGSLDLVWLPNPFLVLQPVLSLGDQLSSVDSSKALALPSMLGGTWAPRKAKVKTVGPISAYGREGSEIRRLLCGQPYMSYSKVCTSRAALFALSISYLIRYMHPS